MFMMGYTDQSHLSICPLDVGTDVSLVLVVLWSGSHPGMGLVQRFGEGISDVTYDPVCLA